LNLSNENPVSNCAFDLNLVPLQRGRRRPLHDDWVRPRLGPVHFSVPPRRPLRRRHRPRTHDDVRYGGAVQVELIFTHSLNPVDP
jgi:hypothetical protein